MQINHSEKYPAEFSRFIHVPSYTWQANTAGLENQEGDALL